ncbi:bifunctional 2-polyprenyl-6-hydroxyphenol methylase/3-demethylubiquinol 3-O-methyltransferase UbiG [Mycobacterium sp. 4858]|uniref:class I SAM-dependent methyltransferase n=1 Tax=Mycobacterium sp. 4858 TaxID=2057185 RepID=UPI000C822D5A|nr:methyltransferase domain-containing protein [Mycobacterium sp. 4858]
MTLFDSVRGARVEAVGSGPVRTACHTGFRSAAEVASRGRVIQLAVFALRALSNDVKANQGNLTALSPNISIRNALIPCFQSIALASACRYPTMPRQAFEACVTEGLLVRTATTRAQYEFIHGILQHETTALNFTLSVLEHSYKSHFPDYSDDVRATLEDVSKYLLAADNGRELYQAAEEVHTRFFTSEGDGSWFSEGYSAYKSQRKPVQDFKNFADAISGSMVLDFGSGRGHLAALVARAGYDCYTTDVMDYRGADAAHLPFRQMASPVDVPYADDMFDSAIIKTVLHHVDEPDLIPLLKNLRRVARRLIIEEDTYAVPAAPSGVAAGQIELTEFTKLDESDQFHALVLIDFFGNAVAQGLVDMNFGCQFKRIDEWHSIFKGLGLRVVDTDVVGFRPGNIHKACQVRFVVDREEF